MVVRFHNCYDPLLSLKSQIIQNTGLGMEYQQDFTYALADT